MKTDLGTFQGTAAARRSQEPAYPPLAALITGSALLTIIMWAAAQVAPLTV